MLLNRPEILEWIAKGLSQNIVKAAREGTMPSDDESEEPDADDPAAAIQAAHRRNRR